MAFDITDMFNSAESEIVAALQGEVTITALVDSGNIHTKLREDPMVYSKQELPAIAVSVHDWQAFTGSARQAKLKGALEVTDHGGELSVVDSSVKTILSTVLNFMRNQKPARGGLCFGEEFEDSDVMAGKVLSFKMLDEEEGFIGFGASGSVLFEITIIN